MSDSHQSLFALHRLDYAADLAVVKPDRFSGANEIEHLRNRAANYGGAEDLAGTIAAGRTARLQVSRQDQWVAALQNDGVTGGW